MCSELSMRYASKNCELVHEQNDNLGERVYEQIGNLTEPTVLQRLPEGCTPKEDGCWELTWLSLEVHALVVEKRDPSPLLCLLPEVS